MHIPTSMLHGGICPITATLSVAGIAAATYFAAKTEERPSAGRFAAVSALLFAAQMVNFPVLHGTSGHLLGGVAAAAMLGTPFAVLSLSMIVTLQTVLFADGGLDVLGANIFNMAIVGAGLGGIMFDQLKRQLNHTAAMATAAMASVLAAASGVCLELATAGAATLTQTLPSMLGVHALIGVGEAVITIALVTICGKNEIAAPRRNSIALPLTGAVICAALLSPLACSWPDGLEWVSTKLHLIQTATPLVSIMPDYTVPAINNTMLTTATAGIIGTFCVLALGFLAGRILQRFAIAKH